MGPKSNYKAPYKRHQRTDTEKKAYQDKAMTGAMKFSARNSHGPQNLGDVRESPQSLPREHSPADT